MKWQYFMKKYLSELNKFEGEANEKMELAHHLMPGVAKVAGSIKGEDKSQTMKQGFDHVLKKCLDTINEKGKVGKGGVVKDPALHEEVIADIINFAESLGLSSKGVTESPILGPKGNKEFLIYLTSK